MSLVSEKTHKKHVQTKTSMLVGVPKLDHDRDSLSTTWCPVRATLYSHQTALLEIWRLLTRYCQIWQFSTPLGHV